MDFNWRVDPGYHETYQLFDETGKIIGSVLGSTWHNFEGWGAVVEYPDSEPIRLGRYTTVGNAKQAIEKYITKEQIKK